MKKTVWQWLTTPIGYDSEYDYWNAKFDKKLKKIGETAILPEIALRKVNELKSSLPLLASDITSPIKLTKLTKAEKQKLIDKCDQWLIDHKVVKYIFKK